jgi:hypothetical protein
LKVVMAVGARTKPGESIHTQVKEKEYTNDSLHLLDSHWECSVSVWMGSPIAQYARDALDVTVCLVVR